MQEFVLNNKVKAHSKYLLKCAVSPDSQHVVTTSADKTAKLWSTDTWEVEQVSSQAVFAP
jgi:G protein beta subunit-like protein